MKFKYQARTKKGEIREGIIEAASQESAVIVLQRADLFVTKIEPLKVPFYKKEISFKRGVSKKDIYVFSRELSTMVGSGVPLLDALKTIALQADNKYLKEKLFKVAEYVEGGEKLSGALSHFPRLFDNFYIGMVKSGEASGTLAESLNYLAEHIEREYYLESRVKGAMIYPAFVISVILAVLGVIEFFVVPKITEIFQGAEVELPFMTRFIINISYFGRRWGWLLIIIFAIIIFYLYTFLKTKEGKEFWGRISLKIPWLGSFLKNLYVSRFAENLSVLVAGGLSISQALHLTAEVVDNPLYKEAILKARDRTRKGEQISISLRENTDLFPPILIQMIKTGEKTGKLDKTLKSVVDFYQKEVEIKLESMLRILEPALIVFLAVVVGLIVAFIILPLYQIEMTAAF